MGPPVSVTLQSNASNGSSAVPRPGWNPTRRNRNIGTAKAGHGEDNRLVIPGRRNDERMFWAKLTNPIVHTHRIQGRLLTVFVEPPRQGCFHPCSAGDVFRMFGHVPPADWDDLSLVLLRQPKRKEEILSSVWGRLVYWVRVGKCEGPAVVLEAQDISKPWRWGRSLSLDAAEELERLRDDGHTIRLTRQGYVIDRTPETCRGTQLYRTLLHEIGHWVDYQRCYRRPSREPDADPSALWERHFVQKPPAEREQFAHQYADRLRAELRKSGVMPFDRVLED